MSNGLYDAFGSNHQLENDGVWYIAHTLDDGREVKFLLARMGGSNKRYESAMEKVSRSVRRKAVNGTISSQQARKVNRKAFVDGCLLDWENVEDKDGNSIPFGKESALDLFDELPDLYDDLVDIAQGREAYAEEMIQEDAKN